ncbi:MAG: DUF2461 domain-containing protein [Myxococcota bacterium]
MAFSGFPKGTKKFLKDIGNNNDRDWFQAHRQDYEDFYLEPAKAFVEAVGKGLEKLAPDVVADPRINGSIFRINRDTRFSKDKTPYKDHLSLWFWDGPDKKSAPSGFYLRLTAKEWHIGVGTIGFEGPRLRRYREVLQEETPLKELTSAVKKIEKGDYEVKGEHYKRVPRGFDADGPAARFAKHNGLYVMSNGPLPKEVHDKTFVKTCLGLWRPLLPLHRWLVRYVN